MKAYLILFALLALASCKLSQRNSSASYTHLVKFDSLHFEKYAATSAGISASEINDSGYNFILNPDRPKIKPGEPIYEYAADNSSSIKYDHLIKKDTAAFKSAVSDSTKTRRLSIDSLGKAKVTSHKTDSTAKSLIPWYAWVIAALLAGGGLFLLLKRK